MTAMSSGFQRVVMNDDPATLWPATLWPATLWRCPGGVC